jgi:glycosyltransferase involved in cell wall biosynthesis
LKRRLLIFETHPIQYRAPVYKALQVLCPDAFEVIYASDFSVRGYQDAEFAEKLSWDVPLLDGYNYRVLGNEAGKGIQEARGLTGAGIGRILRDTRPSAILLHSLGYEFNWVAYGHALLRRIPIWLRTETQDQAFDRRPIKSAIRSVAYHIIYLGINRAFYIGELNKQHYLHHGLKTKRLTPARYCTVDRIKDLPDWQLNASRAELRRDLKIADNATLVAFFGKLIEKKDPGLLLEALVQVPPGHTGFHCLFVGSGPLEDALRGKADGLLEHRGIATHFAGFVNQTHLPRYYLAADIVVLPSRRMGETWGLVANEALQAGCGVVVSEAVGCHPDFQGWERFRTIPVGDVDALAAAIIELAALPRSFRWAEKPLVEYSVESAAAAIHRAMSTLGPSGAP